MTYNKQQQQQPKNTFFCPKGKKNLGQSPPQELEVSPRNGLYLLVLVYNRQLLYTVSIKQPVRHKCKLA